MHFRIAALLLGLAAFFVMAAAAPSADAAVVARAEKPAQVKIFRLWSSSSSRQQIDPHLRVRVGGLEGPGVSLDPRGAVSRDPEVGGRIGGRSKELEPHLEGSGAGWYKNMDEWSRPSPTTQQHAATHPPHPTMQLKAFTALCALAALVGLVAAAPTPAAADVVARAEELDQLRLKPPLVNTKNIDVWYTRVREREREEKRMHSWIDTVCKWYYGHGR
ncbi:uncharacterized protein BXZ73DRAFT_77113 [Epithele typhae]|uniref:uncharacterized protein n=1 Tax=Epithele typhae TaxID=378194 RepID=UPI0020082972|nr:uncharacterized protein BXZ73DRAFT_77113 [Epithele typhae]KAH9934010.1 hypothetical protein BXZ73DRAFT_77113 [Epithele typhae]